MSEFTAKELHDATNGATQGASELKAELYGAGQGLLVAGFKKWYSEQYSGGDVNEAQYRECAAFLEGFIEARGRDHALAFSGLDRCISALRGAANVMEVLGRVERVTKFVGDV